MTAKIKTPVKVHIFQTHAACLKFSRILQIHINLSDILRKTAQDYLFFVSGIEDVPIFIQIAQLFAEFSREPVLLAPPVKPSKNVTVAGVVETFEM